MSNSHHNAKGLSWQSSCCGPLVILSCLTYISPTHSLAIPTVLHCVAGSVWPLRIALLGIAPLSRKEPFSVFTMAHVNPDCCTTEWSWWWCWPSGKQCVCQNPQFLYVKNNMCVLYFTNVAEWLISWLLPWLKVKGAGLWTTLSIYRYGLLAWLTAALTIVSFI